MGDQVWTFNKATPYKLNTMLWPPAPLNTHNTSISQCHNAWGPLLEQVVIPLNIEQFVWILQMIFKTTMVTPLVWLPAVGKFASQSDAMVEKYVDMEF